MFEAICDWVLDLGDLMWSLLDEPMGNFGGGG